MELDINDNIFNNKIYNHFVKCVNILTNDLKHKYDFYNIDIISDEQLNYICYEYCGIIDLLLTRYTRLYNKKDLNKIKSPNTINLLNEYKLPIKNENNNKTVLIIFFDLLNNLLNIYYENKFELINKKQLQLFWADFNLLLKLITNYAEYVHKNNFYNNKLYLQIHQINNN
jgi:hypothetical protein